MNILSYLKANRTILITIVVFITFFTLSVLNNKIPATDETEYHYPNIINFAENGFNAIFNSKYSAANTPLPYILIAWVSKLTGPSLLLARIITCLISLFSFLIILQLFRKMNVPSWYALAILFYPYFFVNSFIFYVVNYGVFFLSMALLLIIENKESYKNDLLIGIFLSLAVLCQQFYIVIPAAIILSRLTLLYTTQKITVKNLLALTISALLIIVPLAAPVFIFFKWGGLTHSNFRMHSLSFYPSTLVAILFVTGVYAIPYLIQFGKKLTRVRWLSALLIAIVIVLLFKPIFADKQGAGLFTGITFHLLNLPSRISPVISNVLMIVFSCLGIAAIYILTKTVRSIWDYSLLLSWIFLGLVYSTNTLIGERHLLPLMIIFFLMMLPRIESLLARNYVLVVSVTGIMYFFYLNFFKFGAA